MADHFGNR